VDAPQLGLETLVLEAERHLTSLHCRSASSHLDSHSATLQQTVLTTFALLVPDTLEPELSDVACEHGRQERCARAGPAGQLGKWTGRTRETYQSYDRTLRRMVVSIVCRNCGWCCRKTKNRWRVLVWSLSRPQLINSKKTRCGPVDFLDCLTSVVHCMPRQSRAT